MHGFLNSNREIINIRHINPKICSIYHIGGMFYIFQYLPATYYHTTQNVESGFLTFTETECRNINKNLYKNKIYSKEIFTWQII